MRSERSWEYCLTHNKSFPIDAKCPMCIKIKTPRTYVRKVRDSIWERFHNYGVKFQAVITWDSIPGTPKVLKNNVQFKIIEFDHGIVKVFKRSILITLRSSAEIKGLPVRVAEFRSKELVNKILDDLPGSIYIQDRSVVNVHNAFVNHPTAQYDVRVVVDGETRAISDHSKGYNEFEFVHPGHAVSDSEILEKFNRDLIVNDPDPLSVHQSKIDHVVNILDRYAVQMELHLKVEEKTLSTMEKIGSYFEDLKLRQRSPIKKGFLRTTSPRCHK